MEYSSYNVNTPQWREITVGSHLPAELRKLAEIAHNLWWTWNDDVKKLYCDLDPGLWKEVEQNPVLFLERINYEKLVALAHDENFVYKMDAVYSAFKKYIDVEPDHQRPSIAYFSMEYGLDEVLKIYSGGLGMLAGDYLKEASDSNVDLCAIGLLYRYGCLLYTSQYRVCLHPAGGSGDRTFCRSVFRPQSALFRSRKHHKAGH